MAGIGRLSYGHSALVALSLLATLSACGKSQPTYVGEKGGKALKLEFIDDSHVRFIGNWGDREWLYTAQRDSKGQILSMEMTEPNIGKVEFREDENTGCLYGEPGRLCPQ